MTCSVYSQSENWKVLLELELNLWWNWSNICKVVMCQKREYLRWLKSYVKTTLATQVFFRHFASRIYERVIDFQTDKLCRYRAVKKQICCLWSQHNVAEKRTYEWKKSNANMYSPVSEIPEDTFMLILWSLQIKNVAMNVWVTYL